MQQMSKTNFIQISTTVAKKVDAEKIGKVLLKKRLSACTQVIGPISSFYKWNGKIKKSREWLCIIKTKKNLYRKIEKELKNIHPYELPEIIVTPITEGSKKYLAWINKECI